MTYSDIFRHVLWRVLSSRELDFCFNLPRIWRITCIFVDFTVFSTTSCGIGISSIFVFVLFCKLAGLFLGGIRCLAGAGRLTG